MAIIKLGPVIADARGSVGGTVFSRNSAGAYMKQRTVPTYRATARQVAVAALLSTVINDWKVNLSTAERVLWNGLASITSLPNKLGEQFAPSGLNLFVKSNMMLDLTGQAHVTAAPVAAIAPQPALTFAHTPTDGIRITDIGNWDNTPTGYVYFQRSPAMPLSVNYYKGPYTSTTVLNFTAFDALPILFSASAILATDARYFYRCRAVLDDGTVSAAASYSCDVGAVA